MSRPSSHWHPGSDRRVVHVPPCFQWPTGYLIHSTSRPSDRRLLRSKITSHRPSCINAQHLSHPSNYLYSMIDPWAISSIPFHLSMIVSFNTPPRRISVTAHRQRVDDSPSGLFVILITVFTCAPPLHLADHYPRVPFHIPVTACTRGVADGPSHPSNIASQYLLPLTSQHLLPTTTGTHTSPCRVPMTAYTQERLIGCLVHLRLPLSDRLHLFPNITSMRLSLTHALSHPSDHLHPKSGRRALSSIQHHVLGTVSSVDHPHTSCCFLATNRTERAADGPSSTLTLTWCPSDHLDPPIAPSPLVHPTSYSSNSFATCPHIPFRQPPPPSSISPPSLTMLRECQTFATSAHPTSRSSDHLYLHPTLCTDNPRHPHPPQIASQ